jgi:hypothetical protein
MLAGFALEQGPQRRPYAYVTSDAVRLRYHCLAAHRRIIRRRRPSSSDRITDSTRSHVVAREAAARSHATVCHGSAS